MYEVFSFEKCVYKTCLTHSVDIFTMSPSFSLGSHSIQNGGFFCAVILHKPFLRLETILKQFNQNTKFLNYFHKSKSSVTYRSANRKERAERPCELDTNRLKDSTFLKSNG